MAAEKSVTVARGRLSATELSWARFGRSGNAGVDFAIGGSITLSNSTVDGIYSGQFNVTVDYQ